MPHRSPVTRLGRAVAALLIGMLAAVPAPVAGWADPGDDPTDTSTPFVPTPTDTGASAAPTDTGAPVDTPTPTPNAPPTTPGDTTSDAPGTLGVTVQASNAVLGADYWSGNQASSFVITVRNSGNVPAHTALTYTLPPGVGGVATGACPHGACTVDTLEPGKSVALTVAITVSPDAWRTAPLAGMVSFSATAPRASPASGSVAWSVVFPPGPPAPGIALQVADVTLDSDATVPGELVIRLTNTGGRPASAVIDIVVPAGVEVTGLPADCQSQRRIDPITTECGLGILGAGGQRALGVPVTVSESSRADSPLAGLVRAVLTPSGQSSRSTQASYQIIAPTAQAGVSAVTTASAAPSHGSAAEHGSPLALPIVLGSILVLALVGVGLVLRLDRRPGVGRTRRLWRRSRLWRGRPFGRRSNAFSARTGPWRPVATFVPPLPGQPAGSPAAGNGGPAEPEPDAAEPAETEPADAEPAGAGGPDASDPVSLVWTELPDSTPPPGRPVG